MIPDEVLLKILKNILFLRLYFGYWIIFYRLKFVIRISFLFEYNFLTLKWDRKVLYDRYRILEYIIFQLSVKRETLFQHQGLKQKRLFRSFFILKPVQTRGQYET